MELLQKTCHGNDGLLGPSQNYVVFGPRLRGALQGLRVGHTLSPTKKPLDFAIQGLDFIWWDVRGSNLRLSA